MKSIKIGKVKLENKLFLAPMVDVTDAAYREICRKCGAGMAYTEMLYVDAITHENDSTKRLMKIGKKDKPLGIQITGNSIEEFEKVIPYLKGYDLVDINCGCPSIRITGNEAGSFLLKSPDKIISFIKLLKKKGFIVTVKIRLGFENNNVMEIAKMIEKAGADALTVHARLAIHSNKIPADWNWIAKVKNELKIPVIGNGDIRTGEDAKKMLEICDGVMVARAAIGDPTIFERINYYLKNGKEKEIDYKKNIELFLEYLKLVKKYDIIDLPRIKYLGSNFFKNFSGASKLRNELHTLKSYDQIYEFLEKFLKHNP